MVAALAFALLPAVFAQSGQPAGSAAGSVTQAIATGTTSLSVGSIQATPTGLGPMGFTIPYVHSSCTDPRQWPIVQRGCTPDLSTALQKSIYGLHR